MSSVYLKALMLWLLTTQLWAVERKAEVSSAFSKKYCAVGTIVSDKKQNGVSSNLAVIQDLKQARTEVLREGDVLKSDPEYHITQIRRASVYVSNGQESIKIPLKIDEDDQNLEIEDENEEEISAPDLEPFDLEEEAEELLAMDFNFDLAKDEKKIFAFQSLNNLDLELKLEDLIIKGFNWDELMVKEIKEIDED